MEALYEKLAALPVDDIDGSPVLFEHVADIAKLKYAALPLWVKLWSAWKSKRVKMLPELGKAVDKRIRSAERKSKGGAGQDGFERDSAGAIMPNLANTLLVVEKMGATLSYDTFLGQPMVEGLGRKFDGALGDAALNRIWTTCESQYGFRPAINNLRLWASDAAFENSFHPVLDYLNGLAWDGVARIDSWLQTYCAAEDSEYARAVGAIWLVAAVRRVREPGCKFDEMLILESARQGLNKSTALAVLAVRDEWFSDSINFSASEKELIEGSTGIWIAEYGELQGMRKGDVEKLKAHRSRRYDRARLAYGHLPTVHARQNVDAGTTNGGKASQYLMDGTGNRRFWPVEVGRCDVEALLRDRDQLWAEAAAREATGASIRLPEALWPAAEREQAQREVPNAFAEALQDRLGDMTGYITKGDAWRLLGIPLERRDLQARKFGEAWRKLGWVEHNWRLDLRGTGRAEQTKVFVKGTPRKEDGRRLVVWEDSFSREVHVGYEGSEPKDWSTTGD